MGDRRAFQRDTTAIRCEHRVENRVSSPGPIEKRQLELKKYDDRWLSMNLDHQRRLGDALSATEVEIEHTGSTSVPGLAAKPIIDIRSGQSTQAELKCLQASQKLKPGLWNLPQGPVMGPVAARASRAITAGSIRFRLFSFSFHCVPHQASGRPGRRMGVHRPVVVAVCPLDVRRPSATPRASMPMPRTRWSQLSALLTGTKLADDS